MNPNYGDDMNDQTVIQQLQAQRSALVNVVRQVEAAIKVLGGTVEPSTNGANGAPQATTGKRSWWWALSQSQRNRYTRRQVATRAARRAERLSQPTVA